jgi:NitT/TauT family transport system permease protein
VDLGQSASGRGIARVASLAGLLLVWWAVAALAHDPGRLPSPGVVAALAWREAIGGPLLPAIAATLGRVLAAFGISMAVGTALGVAAGRLPAADAAIDPWLIVALNLPVLMVVVLVYVWMGLTEAAAIVSVCIAKIPTVVVTVREGARALDPGLDELAEVFGIPGGRRVARIWAPQLAPYIAAAARAGLSVTWKIVLIVELIGRPNGIGFELNLFFQNFDVAGIMAYGLVFSALMLAVEILLLQPLERRVNAWR